MFSMYKQQYDASIGKDDVGIAANGLKVFFALSSYYNDYYKNKFEVTDTEIRRSFKTFSREFVFVNGGEKTIYKPSSVSDVYIPKQVKDKLLNILVNPEFYDTDAALALSSFTSAATDNAKELIMAQVNANAELASMHIYLMILGFTPEQVVEIMTSDVVTQVLTELEVNMLYPGARSKKVGVILEKMLSATRKRFWWLL